VVVAVDVCIVTSMQHNTKATSESHIAWYWGDQWLWISNLFMLRFSM